MAVLALVAGRLVLGRAGGTGVLPVEGMVARVGLG